MKLRPRGNTDPRITANRLEVRETVLLFVGLCIMFTVLVVIYQNLFIDRADSEVYGVMSIISFAVLLTIIALHVFSSVRSFMVGKPVRKLQEAARQVTNGDYSVRLPAHPEAAKRDEFDVLYEDFNTMVEELASTELLKRDFVSNVSHELKTPLAVMQNYATILQSDGLSDVDKRECAEKIANACQRLSVMVSNILQLNRLENQKILTKKKPYNLSEQISRCAIGFAQVWEEKDIDVESDLDQNIILNSDEELLDIVWNNLISNALKFTPNGGTIHISAQQEYGFAVVTVEDTGCGIDEKSIKHIFDQFYQADTSHVTQGNGLGLALVKKNHRLAGRQHLRPKHPGRGQPVCCAHPDLINPDFSHFNFPLTYYSHSLNKKPLFFPCT